MPDETHRQYPDDQRRWYDGDGDLRLSLPVREYIDREIKRATDHERELAGERQRYSEREFITMEDARKLAKVEQDRRLESMNEFREQLNRQAATFVTRELMDAGLTGLRTEIKPLVKLADRSEGGGKVAAWFVPSGTALVTMIVAFVSLAVALYVATRP